MEEKRGVIKISKGNRRLLKDVTSKKINYLLSKPFIKEKETYNIIKEFFREYLQQDYEFTYEELIEELRKIYVERSLKNRLMNFLQKISVIEYKDEEIPQESLKQMLKEFDYLVKNLVKASGAEVKVGFFKRFVRKMAGLEDEAVHTFVPLESGWTAKGAQQEKPVETAPPVAESQPEGMEPVAEESVPEEEPEPKVINEDEVQPEQSLSQEVSEVLDQEQVNKDKAEAEKAQEEEKEDAAEITNWAIEDEAAQQEKKESAFSKAEGVEIAAETPKEEPEVKKKPAKKSVAKKKSVKKEKPVEKDDVGSLIQKITDAVKKGDKDSAKSLYKQALSVYNALEEEEKTKYYDRINNIYKEITS
jgi:hypothetical protein